MWRSGVGDRSTSERRFTFFFFLLTDIKNFYRNRAFAFSMLKKTFPKTQRLFSDKKSTVAALIP